MMKILLQQYKQLLSYSTTNTLKIDNFLHSDGQYLQGRSHIIPAKQTSDVIIIATIFCGKSIIKNHTIIRSRQAIIYQLTNHHSILYINNCCKKNLFYCCYLSLLNSIQSFLRKAIVLKPVFIPLQTMDNDTHVYVHS